MTRRQQFGHGPNVDRRKASRTVGVAPSPVVEALVVRMTASAMASTAVIPWSSPVPAFGDLASARVATLGLNPSNREFVDARGNELDGPARRFPTLRSLGLTSWEDATHAHYGLIEAACRQYFSSNPYDAWFRKLNRIISGTGASYYASSACHLDLIPYATACKWTELTSRQRVNLLEHTGDTLGILLRTSPVQVLVLNGRSVVDGFEAMTKHRLTRRVFASWALPRRSADVQGIGYEGIVDSVGGVDLGRSLTVLGFNHNVQSSFGVTREVIGAIAGWIARLARGMLR